MMELNYYTSAKLTVQRNKNEVIIYRINQFRYIKIQPKTRDPHEIPGNKKMTTEFVGFIPQSLVLRSILLS